MSMSIKHIIKLHKQGLFKIQSRIISGSDKNDLINLYNKLRTIKKVKTKNRIVNETNGRDVRTLRLKIKQYASSTVIGAIQSRRTTIQVPLPTNLISMKLSNEDRRGVFINFYSDYERTLRQFRMNNKRVNTDCGDYMGFEYRKVGGVFTIKNGILALQTMESQMRRLGRSKQPNPGSPTNYVGVELELICSMSRNDLQLLFAKEYLGGYVYIKGDSSIRPENPTERGHEVTIMVPEDKYESIINRVCKVLNRKEVGCYVNNSCGMHVHFDARHRDHTVMFNNFVKVMALGKQMIPQDRVTSNHAAQYCKQNTSADWLNNIDMIRSRYQAVNAESYRSHNTIEVRVHSGTTNANKINMWIKTFLNAAQHTSSIVAYVNTVDAYMTLFGMDTKLMEYMNRRIKLFNYTDASKILIKLDTRADHFLFNESIAI